MREFKLSKEQENTHVTHDSQSIDYLKKSLSPAYLQEQLQSPAKSPVQSSDGQSGAGQSSADNNKK